MRTEESIPIDINNNNEQVIWYDTITPSCSSQWSVDQTSLCIPVTDYWRVPHCPPGEFSIQLLKDKLCFSVAAAFISNLQHLPTSLTLYWGHQTHFKGILQIWPRSYPISVKLRGVKYQETKFLFSPLKFINKSEDPDPLSSSPFSIDLVKKKKWVTEWLAMSLCDIQYLLSGLLALIILHQS